MGVHDLGYRKWSGARALSATRWMVIARTGIQRAWQSRWLRRLLLFAWLPAFWFAIGFFLWEQSLLEPGLHDELEPFLRGMPRTERLMSILDNADPQNPDQARHQIWAWLLQSFFRYPQGVILAFVVGLIAPPLISQDVRSRAFLLYFSRPISRHQYVFGKTAAIWFFLTTITTLPALSLYGVGVLLSPSVSVIYSTWDLPLRILAASALLMLPTAALALCLSSLTQESRFAGFAWFAIWILGWFTYTLMTTVEAIQEEMDPLAKASAWSHLSLYHTLGQVQSWVFGFAEFRDVRTYAGLLLVITALSLVILYRRVTAPLRA
jgi:ABC-type transport system involved in multi-copper enzyme maturation permease subunit